MTGANNRINLTRISHVKFWALATARAGYANRCAPNRGAPAELSALPASIRANLRWPLYSLSAVAAQICR